MAKLAAQLYTVRDYCRTPEGVLSTLSKIKEMGYDGVEIEGIYKVIDAETAANHLNKIGLEVCATRSPLTRTELDFDGMVHEAKLYQCKNVGIGNIMRYWQPGLEAWYKYLQYVSPVAEKFADQGLKATYCHEAYEFIKESNGKHGFDIIFEGTEPENFYFELDTFWLAKAGLSMPDYVKKVAGRMDVIRFRDQKVTEGSITFFHPKRELCEVGEGLFDFKAIMPILEETGVSWISLGQEFCTRDPFECLKISLDNVKQMM